MSTLDAGGKELRRRAEERLARDPQSVPRNEAEIQRQLHELQVHQIELEMQNEALRQMADSNGHLEEMVGERTSELAAARDFAEAANRAKSSFLANMSHELRTPMSAIIGMTELSMRSTTDPKLLNQLSKVKRASMYLLDVINDILDISKIDANRLELENMRFRLGNVLEDISSMIADRVSERGLVFHLEIAPDLAWQPLQGDPMRLSQILLNLIGNALKFTAQGTITVRALLAENNPDDVVLRFEVEDTGIGISPENQKRVFSAFEQADTSTTRKYGGTGLGLAISKQLVQLMGGEIGVNSTMGEGSIFWVTARFLKDHCDVDAGQDQQFNLAEAELRTRYSHCRILLAEDEPINQEVSQGLLEEVGLKVDLAVDGLHALEMAKAKTYDLILMDMQMPQMNGIDATRAIRALPEYANIPILAMTANAFGEDRKHCLEAGMSDHIGKPVDPDLLFETLLKWLSQR
jgi:signal transduction histidine kinase/ActR/RegA family two-component response regulator